MATGADIENTVSFETLTKAGKTNESFRWDTWEFTTEDDPKWVDADGIATKKFKPGEAIWVQGDVGYKFQTAGQVSQEDLIVALTNGNVAVGNSFPVEVDIQDIVATGEDVENTVSFETLTKAGKTNESFRWDTWEFTTEDDPKWVDSDGIATKKFKPGEAIWVQGDIGYTIRIPAPDINGKDE